MSSHPYTDKNIKPYDKTHYNCFQSLIESNNKASCCHCIKHECPSEKVYREVFLPGKMFTTHYTMPSHPYPKGSYIVNESKDRRKVLEELGDLRFVSVCSGYGNGNDWETAAADHGYSIEDLKRDGWKVEGEVEGRWEPRENEQFFIVTTQVADATVSIRTWVAAPYQYANWESGNCFKTREEAQLKCDKINQILKER